MGIKDLFKKVVVDKPFEEAKRKNVSETNNNSNNQKQSTPVSSQSANLKTTTPYQSKYIQSQPTNRYTVEELRKSVQKEDAELAKYSLEKIPEGCADIPREVYTNPADYNKNDKARGYEYVNPTRFLYPKGLLAYPTYDTRYKSSVRQTSQHLENASKYARQKSVVKTGATSYERNDDIYFTMVWKERSPFTYEGPVRSDLFWVDYKNTGEQLSDCKYVVPKNILPHDDFVKKEFLTKDKLFYIDWTYQGKKYTNVAQAIYYGATSVDDKRDFAKMYENGNLVYSEYVAWAYTDGITVVDFYDMEDPDTLNHNIQALDSTGERIPDAEFRTIAKYATNVIGRYQDSRIKAGFMAPIPKDAQNDLFSLVTKELESVFTDGYKAGRLAHYLPTIYMTIGDDRAPKAQARKDFVMSFKQPYQRVAALLVAHLPIDHDNLLESMTCKDGILDTLDKLVELYNFPKEYRFKIQQLVLSVSDIEDPLRDQFRRYYICGANNLRELCEFRNKFYEMGLGIQRSIAARADRNMIVKPTEKDYLLADYENALRIGVHSDSSNIKLKTYYLDGSVCDRSKESNGYIHLWRPSFTKNHSAEIPDSDAKWISISAKNAADFNQKLYTLLPDLMKLGADVYIASKQNVIENGESFISGSKVCGHHIMIKQDRFDIQQFLDKHPELLIETGTSVSNANHLCGCIYGYYGLFGETTKSQQKFTLDDFIDTCNNHPIDKKDGKRYETEYFEFVNRHSDAWSDRIGNYLKIRNKMIWNFYAANRHEFEKYRTENGSGGYTHLKFGDVRGKHNGYNGWEPKFTVAQEIGYARDHDPFGFNEKILDPVNYEMGSER